jgi:hypothetical protein
MLITFNKFFSKGTQKFNEEFDLVIEEDGNSVYIMKYNNNGIFVANIQYSKTDRIALRLAVVNYVKSMCFLRIKKRLEFKF